MTILSSRYCPLTPGNTSLQQKYRTFTHFHCNNTLVSPNSCAKINYFYFHLFTWYISKDLDRFVHRFVGITNVLFHILSIDAGKRIIHPTLVPSEPVRSCNPQVAERFEVFHQLREFIVLYERDIIDLGQSIQLKYFKMSNLWPLTALLILRSFKIIFFKNTHIGNRHPKQSFSVVVG